MGGYLNISFILPCFRRAAWLRAALPLNEHYRSPDVEVILVLDEPSEEKEVMAIVRDNPGIRFKVIINDWQHAWRPPCIPINVGVRHAVASHIAILSPETMLWMPHPCYLQYLLSKDWRPVYGGVLWHVTDAEPTDGQDLMRGKLCAAEAMRAPSALGFGFILCQRLSFERICGMDEMRAYYGGDDDDLRQRLVMTGHQMMIDPNIRIFHPTHEAGVSRDLPKDESKPTRVMYHQRETWGRAFSRKIWDWSKL